MMILTDAETTYDQIQHIFMAIIFCKVGIQENILNMKKSIYKELTCSIQLNSSMLSS